MRGIWQLVSIAVRVRRIAIVSVKMTRVLKMRSHSDVVLRVS